MTVGELKQHLYELSEDGTINEDTEIRIAIQPAWAFEHSIRSDEVTVANGKFYLAEWVQEGYLDDKAREGLGW